MNCHQKSNWIWRRKYTHITLAKILNKKIYLHQASTTTVEFCGCVQAALCSTSKNTPHISNYIQRSYTSLSE